MKETKVKPKLYDSFSEKLLGKEITLLRLAFDSKAGAILKLKNEIITLDENGAISQGAPGEQYLLENIREIKKGS